MFDRKTEVFVTGRKGGGPIKDLIQSFSCISPEMREISEPIKDLQQKKGPDIDYFFESKKVNFTLFASELTKLQSKKTQSWAFQ